MKNPYNLVGGTEVWPGVFVPIPMYGTEAGWVRAHSGGTMNGLLVVVVALALPKLNLSETARRWMIWGLIYVAWSFTVFYWFGNASSNCGLSLGTSALGPRMSPAGSPFYRALPSVILVLILLVLGAKGVPGTKPTT